MMNKLIILLACFGLAFQLSSCTSKDSQADSEVAADADSADLEKLEGEETLATGGNSIPSDQLPEEALGETSVPVEKTTTTETTTTTTENTVGDNMATTEHMDIATTTETLPADPLAEATDVPAPPSDMPKEVTSSQDKVTMLESSMKTEHSTTIVENPEPKSANIPLQKVATAPWKVGKKWLNAVYFARPGDTLSGISQMIYGVDKVSELKKGNPTYKSRGVKPGDKVYYNSPNRPDDSAKMVTYYEDNGISPETYVAKSGDNIKKVSKNLLGYSKAWKEIWAINSVDSQGNIPEGTELRYWKGGAMATASAPPQIPKSDELVSVNAVSTQEPQHVPPAPHMEPAKPEAQQQAQAEIPPPPPMPEQMPPEMAPPPPPPPPAEIAQHQEVAPPPPPPVESVVAPKQPASEETPSSEGMDKDTTLALAVVGLAAAGLAALIVVRKKRKQRELEQQAMDSTHVGT